MYEKSSVSDDNRIYALCNKLEKLKHLKSFTFKILILII